MAIADVSHYVGKGTALDAEARNRGTSVYFPNRVIPMLPEALSNGLCSLKPDVDRLCMVCEMHVDKAGKVSKSRFYRAVMRSAQRFTYEQVAGILQHEDERTAPAVRSPCWGAWKPCMGCTRRFWVHASDAVRLTLRFPKMYWNSTPGAGWRRYMNACAAMPTS